ncbi:MAG: phage holin family protein [Ruminococcaceae bacterium]|nr:phage holin family protein [Oscillospiraceae bacterium]
MDRIKIVFITVFTAVNTALGSLAVPFYLLVVTNIIDYGTGICASVCMGEKISSAKGFKGIAKKVCMWLLVLVGAIVDYMMLELSHTLHIETGFGSLVAVAVVFWLLANELISILENIGDIGVPLPAFLMKILEMIKEKTEYTAENEQE